MTIASQVTVEASDDFKKLLAWQRAITIGQGTQQLVLVPLAGDATLFARSAYAGARYLVVAKDAHQNLNGNIVELLLQRNSIPVDTAALLTNLYRGYHTGKLTAPTQGTGLVLFYSAEYHYRTGRRFEQGTLLPGPVRLAFKAPQPATPKAQASPIAPAQVRTSGALTAPVAHQESLTTCTDWYQLWSDGSLTYIMTTGDCSYYEGGSGGVGGSGGPYGGSGDSGGEYGSTGGGGGPSGYGGPTTVVKPPSPCATLTRDGQHPAIQAKLNDLKGLVTDDKEYGVGMYYDDAGNPQFVSVVGQSGVGKIDITITGTLSSFSHTHYTGLLPIFSGSDLRTMYTLYAGGHMDDPSTFSMNLITASGTVYSLAISDAKAFAAFGASTLKDGNTFDSFEVLYGSLYQINTSRTVADNQKAFLQMLTQAKTGLTLYKGDASNFSSWQKISYNNTTSTTVLIPCK